MREQRAGSWVGIGAGTRFNVYPAGGTVSGLVVAKAHLLGRGAPLPTQTGGCVPCDSSPGARGLRPGRGAEGRYKQKVPWIWSGAAAPGRACVVCTCSGGVRDLHPGCLHNCADAAGLGFAAGGGRRGGRLPVVVRRVAHVACG